MRALFVGPGGSFVMSCGKLLILRDNVQHHLQAGRVTREYFLIHEIADIVVMRSRLRTSARALWAEFARAFARIGDVCIRDLAISIRTHAILSGVAGFPAIQGTILVRLTRWRVSVPAGGLSTLGELFADVRSGIERVTAAGASRAPVEVSSHPTLVLVQGAREKSADDGTSAHSSQHDK